VVGGNSKKMDVIKNYDTVIILRYSVTENKETNDLQ
jgi:hypothetical protein